MLADCDGLSREGSHHETVVSLYYAQGPLGVAQHILVVSQAVCDVRIAAGEEVAPGTLFLSQDVRAPSHAR